MEKVDLSDLLIDYENLSFNINNAKVVHQMIFYDTVFIAYHCSKNRIDMINMLLDEFKTLYLLLKKEAKLFPHVQKSLNFLRDIAIRFAWTDVKRAFDALSKEQLSTGVIIYNTANKWLDKNLTATDAINLEEAVKYLLKSKRIYPEDFDQRYEEVLRKFI